MRYFLFGVLPYLALGILAGGLYAKGRAWRGAETPVWAAPFDREDSPAGPARLFGLGGTRMLGPWLWPATILFHYSLAMILFWHLRLVLPSIPEWFGYLRVPVIAAGFLLPISLFFLLMRRSICPVARVISKPADTLALLLLLAVSLSGLAVGHLFRVNLVEVKMMALGVVTLKPYLPDGLGSPVAFILHFFLAMVLLIYIPFSNLTHGLGFVLSLRKKKGEAPWLKKTTPSVWPNRLKMQEKLIPNRTVESRF